MKSVDRMVEEHRLIERMLRVLEDSARVVERGGPVPPGMLAGILEFLQVYADAGHHAKEEDLFFPALAGHGLSPDASAVHALQAQHEGGRGLVKELREALPGVERGETGSRQAFAATSMDYIGLLREHIRLEDHYFPEYANACFTPADDEALLARMDAEDRARGLDSAKYERMVAEYEEALLKC
jgi:hemerythrin-like domain-containing protein